MGRAIFPEPNRVVSCDVQYANVAESAQSDGASSVRDEVEESPTERDDGSVRGKTVHDTSHGMFAHTITDIPTGPVTELGGGRLEVD